MNKPVDDRLRRLGAGESIPSLCKTSGMSRQQFEDWWRDEIRSRVPEMEGRHELAVTRPVQIERDCWGIPHISAEDDQDLFFGYGFAMAQDRLFQLDYLRRKGQGRLAEILGPDGVESDLLVRTVGLAGHRGRGGKSPPGRDGPKAPGLFGRDQRLDGAQPHGSAHRIRSPRL